MKAFFACCAIALAPMISVAADVAPTTDLLSVFITPYPPPRDIKLPGDDDHHFRLRWSVSLDAAGHVTRIEATDHGNETVRTALEGAVRGWRFVPGSVAGRPAATDTMLTVDVTLVPLNDEKLVVHIDNVRTGGDIRRNGVKPLKYPMDAFRHHQQGVVVLKVDYDTSGRVVSAIPHDGAPAAAPELTVSATRAVKTWMFSPEIVGGHALAGSLIVPICYEIFGDRLHPPPASGCDWAPAGSTRHDNDVMAIQPAARVESDVIGKTL